MKQRKGIVHILLLLLLFVIPITAAVVFFSLNRSSEKSVKAASGTTAFQPFTACATNCGEPRNFCDTWTGGFCDDYRDLYCPTLTFLTDCPFPGKVRNDVTATFLSSTDPNYIPSVDHIVTPAGFFFNQQEHFHTEVKDGNFGMAIVRQHEPFDFAGRTGHLHIDVDLKTSMRRYVRMIISPELTKTTVDDRQGFPRPSNAIDIWFRNGNLVGNLYKNAGPVCVGGCGNLFSVAGTRGVDNVRNHVDLFISRTHMKMQIDGVTKVDQDVPDIGFDRGYVYLDQASYNPCKDTAANTSADNMGGVPDQCIESSNVFHWDNLAFDGPQLPQNALTPVGYRDIVFNAGWTNSCSFKGQPANIVGPAGSGDGRWATYVIRVPDDGSSASSSDVSCNYQVNVNKGIYDFEIVKQGPATGGSSPVATTNPVSATPIPVVSSPTPPTIAPTPVPVPSVGLQITTPTTGQTVSGIFRINSAAINNSGVNAIDVQVDGVKIGSDVTSPFWYDWDTRKTPNGPHTIYVISTDKQGFSASVTNVVVNNTVAVAPTPAPTPVSQPQPIAGNWKAEYFNNTSLSGTPVVVMNNLQDINYDWGYAAPAEGVNIDNFSARFTGTFNFDGSTYRFNATGDDGVRVKVDGQIVIDGWKNQSATTYNALKGYSGIHTVVVEYYDKWANAILKSNWVHTSCMDMTGDSKVTDADVNVVAAHFSAKGQTPWDVNGDGVVNSLDVAKVSAKKGTSCS